MSKQTVSVKSVKNSSMVGVEKLYPIETYDKVGKEHKSIAIKLTKQQAIELATDLLIGAKEWDELFVTGFKQTKPYVTVTSRISIEEN